MPKVSLNFGAIAQLATPLRMLVFVLLLAIAWLPFAVPLSLAIGDANLRSIVVMGPYF